MEHMRTVKVPAKTEEVVEYLSCDLCHERINQDQWEVDGVEVRHKTGNSYPEGGSGEETIFDLCGKCFDEKLVAWLRSQGAEPRKKEWDY